jgi:hypothetical protein
MSRLLGEQPWSCVYSSMAWIIWHWRQVSPLPEAGRLGGSVLFLSGASASVAVAGPRRGEGLGLLDPGGAGKSSMIRRSCLLANASTADSPRFHRPGC